MMVIFSQEIGDGCKCVICVVNTTEGKHYICGKMRGFLPHCQFPTSLKLFASYPSSQIILASYPLSQMLLLHNPRSQIFPDPSSLIFSAPFPTSQIFLPLYP